ncbi:MAG: hypothetical protein RIC56_05200 [Pseudomonadales bacterium]
MRFVIGLLSGAGAILLLAQLAGAPDARWLERLPDWFDRLAGAAGEALALPPRPPTPTPPPELAPRHTADPVDVAEATAALPAQQPIPRPPDTRPMDTADEDTADEEAPDAAPPDRVDGTVAEVSEPVAEDVEDIVSTLFGSAPSAPAQSATPATGSQAAGMASALAGLAALSGGGSQPVWVPFHSRMSASGFAEQLSASLDHPFQVERRGPGRYQVVFGYRDEPQRQALLAQAAELTGLEL